MRIGFDLDDVIVDFFPSFLNWYNMKYNQNFQMKDMTSFYLWEVGIGKNKEEVIGLVEDFFRFNRDLPFVYGAQNGLNELRDRDVLVITSRLSFCKDGTRDFMDRKLNGIGLYFTDDFNGGDISKAKVARELGVEIYFEDCLKYAQNCLENGINVYLFDRPWNQDEFPLERRVYDWNEILEKINRLTWEKLID